MFVQINNKRIKIASISRYNDEGYSQSTKKFRRTLKISNVWESSYFDLTKEENQRICFNYRNLQPLWARDNYKKSDEVPDNVEELVEFLKQEIYE